MITTGITQMSDFEKKKRKIPEWVILCINYLRQHLINHST